MNSNVFSIHFCRCLVFHVALLICKFSDILNMSLSNWKHVQKNREQMKLEERTSWGLYVSKLEKKQERWIVGIKWAWCRGYSHIDKAWPSRLLPPPWMCPRGSKIEPCSFWTYVITSRWTSVAFWWMAFSITGGSGHWAVSGLSARFRIFVCFGKCSLRGLGQTSVGDAMGQHRQWSLMLQLLHIMVFCLQLHPGDTTFPAVLSESIQISSINLLVWFIEFWSVCYAGARHEFPVVSLY